MQNLRHMVDTGVDIVASSSFTGLQAGGPGSGRHPGYSVTSKPRKETEDMSKGRDFYMNGHRIAYTEHKYQQGYGYQEGNSYGGGKTKSHYLRYDTEGLQKAMPEQAKHVYGHPGFQTEPGMINVRDDQVQERVDKFLDKHKTMQAGGPDLDAGGAGSGCKGSNCGRPRTSHPGAGHKGGSTVRPGERKALERNASRGSFADEDHKAAHGYAGKAISVAKKLGDDKTVQSLSKLQSFLKSGGVTGPRHSAMVDKLVNKHFSKSENLQEKANRMREGRGDSRESKRLDKQSSLHEKVYNHLNDLQDNIDRNS